MIHFHIFSLGGVWHIVSAIPEFDLKFHNIPRFGQRLSCKCLLARRLTILDFEPVDCSLNPVSCKLGRGLPAKLHMRAPVINRHHDPFVATEFCDSNQGQWIHDRRQSVQPAFRRLTDPLLAEAKMSSYLRSRRVLWAHYPCPRHPGAHKASILFPLSVHPSASLHPTRSRSQPSLKTCDTPTNPWGWV